MVLLLALVCFCLFLTLNCSYLCLRLLKTVFRQPSREHLVEGFGLPVVTKTTPPLCRKRLSMYALSRERVYNYHPDNDTGNLVTEPLSSNGRPLRFIYSGFQAAHHNIPLTPSVCALPWQWEPKQDPTHTRSRHSCSSAHREVGVGEHIRATGGCFGDRHSRRVAPLSHRLSSSRDLSNLRISAERCIRRFHKSPLINGDCFSKQL
jgi:hypothetical protein